MSNKVIVPENNVAIKSIYDDFSIRMAVTSLQEMSRRNVVSMLSGAVFMADIASKLGDLEKFSVEIPSELITGIKDGTLHFDNSKKVFGNFTPNIRNSDGKIVGQAMLKKGVNQQFFTSALTSLAVFAMVAQILQKLDEISSSVNDIKIGQENDRWSEVISGFRDFYIAYTSNPNDARDQARIAYSKMTSGLTKIHKHIDYISDPKHFRMAPGNKFWAFIYGNCFMNPYRNKLKNLEAKLVEYQQLELLFLQ